MNDKTETPLWAKAFVHKEKVNIIYLMTRKKRRDNIETSKIHLLVDSWTWPRAELYKKPHRFG